MSFLEIALRNASRGFRTIPLRPGEKRPFLKGWPSLATTDEAQIRQWAERFPDYNCGVAGGSDLVIIDTDRLSRLKDLCGESWAEWTDTYSVSSGRPDRAHFYYLATPEVLEFGSPSWAEPEIDGHVFEVKGRGKQATAEGSIHPDTGQPYQIVQDKPLIPFPLGLLALLRELQRRDNANGSREWSLPLHDGEGREDFFVSHGGKLRNAGADPEIILAQFEKWNEDPAIMAEPKPQEDLERIARSLGRYDVPAPDPLVVIGKPKPKPGPPKDWREWYHSADLIRNAPSVTFLIDGFLTCDGITALAAPVAQRKSLIALNVCHALVTGEPLFGHFKVTNRPNRVLYLCPEMGLHSFSKRLKEIGLLDHVGKTLFCRTMASENRMELADLTSESLDGAVVFLDTITRWMKGNENDSEAMRQLAEQVFRLIKDGAASVLMLHHSQKGTKDSGDLTLENSMRGSGELGAFIASCWATRLQDPDEPYTSASYLKNVKQRDFESEPFEVVGNRETGRLTIAGTPGNVRLQTRPTNKANKDGREAEALDFIRANPTMPILKVVTALKQRGIVRGKTWISDKRAEVLGVGVTLSG